MFGSNFVAAGQQSLFCEGVPAPFGCGRRGCPLTWLLSSDCGRGEHQPRRGILCASWRGLLLSFLKITKSILDVVDRAEREPPGNEENLLKRDFSLAGLLGRYPCLAGSVTVVVAALPSAPEETRTEARWQRVWWHWKSASEKTGTRSVITGKRKRRRGVALREVALERT